MEVLADENLGVYWDQELREPVTFIEFRGAAFEPPLRAGVKPEWVYLVNRSGMELSLIEPCREVFDGDNGPRIGWMDPPVSNLNGVHIGHVCENPVLAPGQVVRVHLGGSRPHTRAGTWELFLHGGVRGCGLGCAVRRTPCLTG